MEQRSSLKQVPDLIAWNWREFLCVVNTNGNQSYHQTLSETASVVGFNGQLLRSALLPTCILGSHVSEV